MKKLNFEPSEPYATHIGPAVAMRGKLRSSLPLDLRCSLNGSIEASFIRIASSAHIETRDCDVAVAIIAGDFAGSMRATESILILPNAKVHAHIKAARVQIADGALFEGEIDTISLGNPH
jgi:cytoskeletal protein CcmA (bactofilin family)